MSDVITFNLLGAEALSAAFQNLKVSMREQIVLPAALDAMDIVLAASKDGAARVDDPTTPNYIPANIKKAQTESPPGSIQVSVGLKKGRKGSKGGNTFYWQWVELGTIHIRPHPFMRDALTQNMDAVFKEFIGSARHNALKFGVM